MTIRFAIWNENTIRKGDWISDEQIAAYELSHDGEHSDDWTIYEGSESDLLDLADAIEAANSGGHRLREAESIREAVSSCA